MAPVFEAPASSRPPLIAERVVPELSDDAPQRAAPSPRPPPRRRKPGRSPARKAPRRPRRRWIWPLIRLMLVGVIWMVIGLTGVVVWFGHDLPDPVTSANVTRRPSVTLLAADGSQLASFGDIQGDTVRTSDVPRALVLAILATEDRRFFKHFGLDLVGIARASVVNLRAGRVVQGGSTLTQQVAKNLFLTHDRTFKRKIQEVLLALWLEQTFTKDQILSLYLNRVYLGAGTHGVDAAARRYFDRPVGQINLYQAALLAGLPKAPSRLNPVTNPDGSRVRTLQVLQNMVGAKMITPVLAKQAAALADGAIPGAQRGGMGSYFADWILERVDDFAGPRDRDLIVRTTLDPVQQRSAEAAVAGLLAEKGAAMKASQAALVALAPDGAVTAMVGGRDHATSPFNRAAQARRQPGSAFKPFVFLAGLEAGLTPSTMMDDAPITVNGWSPGNYKDKYKGRVSLTQAFAQSLNTVAVRVSETAGRGAVVKVAHRLGVVGSLSPLPSIALGVFEVSPLDLTAAYAPFANGGYAVVPHGILSIADRDGDLLYKRQDSGPRRVVAPELARSMDTMLGAVVSWGTGRAARLADRMAHGKTGTSQGYRDAWFVGYAGKTLAGVWVGNDDGTPMRDVTGGILPTQIWHAFMLNAP